MRLFAHWLDRHATLVEQDEIVGYHLERAYRNRSELDSADPRLGELARRAAARLSRAARGATERGDVSAFCGLCQRAAELLPDGDPQRLELAVRQRLPARDGRPSARGDGRSTRAGVIPGPRASRRSGFWRRRWPTCRRAVRRAAGGGAPRHRAQRVRGGRGRCRPAWTGFLEAHMRWQARAGRLGLGTLARTGRGACRCRGRGCHPPGPPPRNRPHGTFALGGLGIHVEACLGRLCCDPCGESKAAWSASSLL